MNILDIWKENAEFVLRICLRYIKDMTEAEDVRQEVFLKIIDSKKKFKRQSTVKTWIYSITFNCCADHFRRLRRQREIEDEILHTGNLCLNDSQTPVWEVNKPSQMPCPISQLFVELHFGEGWDSAEIGQVFGFSIVHVNRKIQEGIEHLKKII
jgi:RNA polymerase sigma-70 factor (ECF subfamily)